MMATDRTPGSGGLDPALANQLRDSLSRSLQSGSHGDDLKELLQRCAIDARKRGMLAEQLLLALKDVWYSLPNLATQPSSETQTRLLQQLIARCIQEYYAN